MYNKVDLIDSLNKKNDFIQNKKKRRVIFYILLQYFTAIISSLSASVSIKYSDKLTFSFAISLNKTLIKKNKFIFLLFIYSD
jgi:hypothetical protein